MITVSSLRRRASYLISVSSICERNATPPSSRSSSRRAVSRRIAPHISQTQMSRGHDLPDAGYVIRSPRPAAHTISYHTLRRLFDRNLISFVSLCLLTPRKKNAPNRRSQCLRLVPSSCHSSTPTRRPATVRHRSSSPAPSVCSAPFFAWPSP